jgi:hypothetical protein
MTMTTCCRQLFTSAIVPSVILAASLFYAGNTLAAQTKNAFTVTVQTASTGDPKNPVSDSAFCRSNTLRGSFGATVTVVCKTGSVVDIQAFANGSPRKPTHGGAYRFITRFAVAADYRDTISSRGVGTVTSWRTVNLQDRDYLELLIGW